MARDRGNEAGAIRTWGRTRPGEHVPVMVREVMKHLGPAGGEAVVDCTVGFGGHAREFIKRVGPTGRLVALDIDGQELARTRERLAGAAVASFHHANFTDLPGVLAAEGIDAADVIFADLGASSVQLDDPARGMSYKHADAPLDMRMDPAAETTAADLLTTMSEADLSAALRDLADEGDHERIANWIVAQRAAAPIARTGRLIRLVMDAKGLTERNWRESPATRYGELHPAARTFQALRIMVNDELGNLRRLLEVAPACLRPGGRIGIISFHSGEDRLVKRAFRAGRRDGTYESTCRRVIVPRPGEVRANPRCASAKFRWALAPP